MECLMSSTAFALRLAAAAAATMSVTAFRQSAARALHERERCHEVASSALELALLEVEWGLDLGSDGVGNASGTNAFTRAGWLPRSIALRVRRLGA